MRHSPASPVTRHQAPLPSQEGDTDCDIEREVSGSAAVALAHSWAERNSLRFTSRVIDAIETVNNVTTGAALFDSKGRLLARSSGKGTGAQSVASGLFESIEHAATHCRIPGQSDPTIRGRLPDNRVLETLDACYGAALQLASARDQRSARIL